jgi:GR25 family glycosyltransferase involved in LPS biosynthesis
VKSLDFTFNDQVDSAYIITIKGNKISEQYSERCAKSCNKFGIKYHIHEAFYVKNKEVIIPKDLKSQKWISWIKIMNKSLMPSEIACFLSHISLWAKCLEIDKPIIILEHDAILIKPYRTHTSFNSIVYLGSKYQLEKKDHRMIYGQLNSNYRFIYCAHAYAIDPYIAKNLLSQVIKYGITTSLDAFIRADIFTIIQNDIYAYDDGQISTIEHPNYNPEENQKIYLNSFKSF